jgi:muconolactone delta-isomerase
MDEATAILPLLWSRSGRDVVGEYTEQGLVLSLNFSNEVKHLGLSRFQQFCFLRMNIHPLLKHRM